MRVLIASQDQTETVGAQIRENARRHAMEGGPRFLFPEHSAIALKAARDQADYLRIYNRLIGIRHGIQTESFAIPRKAGWIGKIAVRIREFLWKLLRYQHERIVWQQNLINELVIAGLEFEREEYHRAIARLEKRMARLESQNSS
ncbi:MAG: hypothetical protein ABIH24_06530 [Verrucomicrobiota bacterium]